MSPTYAKRLLVPALFCLQAAPAFAQVGSNHENSPYSRYGIGELDKGGNAIFRGMGYANTAWAPSLNTMSVNADNPASYAFLRFATYEGAGEGNLRKVLIGTTTYNTGSANFSYVNVGVPIGRRGGLAFGLRPQSRVYYNLADSFNATGLGATIRQDTGSGGLNYAFLGGAYRVGGFSLGVNGGYMFGTISNSSFITLNDTVLGQSTQFTRYTKIGGLFFKGGLQYQDTIGKVRIGLGATVTFNQTLGATRDAYSIGYRNVGGSRFGLTDTAVRVDEGEGKVVLPMIYRFGAMVGSNNWSVYGDVEYANWSSYRNFGATDSLNDGTLRFGLGAEITPGSNGRLTNYLSRVTYRFGGFYGTDYVKLRNTDLNFYGLTVGGSFPLGPAGAFIDKLHTAFEFGRRGNTTNGLNRETTYKFTLGITLNASRINERWFIKRRYD